MFNNSYMETAIQMAKDAYSIGEIPIGAVIVDEGGIIIAKSHNLVEKLKNSTFHAEILAINEACLSLGEKYLINCSMYVTLEPCYMCAGAISMTKISKLYIGAEDKKFGAILNGARIFQKKKLNHFPEVYSGIMEQECSDLIKSFFFKIR